MSTVVETTSLDGLLDAISVAVAESGLPQVTLAHETGLSTKHVCQMMTGRVDGSLRAWQSLMDVAGVRFTARIEVGP